jgi:hypothetical protein
MKELVIDIDGPYSFLRGSSNPSIFDSSKSDQVGLYIWTVPFKDSELVYYVGETGRSYRERMWEHLKGYLSGEYGINEPAEMLNGNRVRIWAGVWRGANIQDFLDRYEYFTTKIMELLRLFRIYLLPVDCDSRLRKRIEGFIVKSLFDQKGVVGGFQEPDYSYQRPKSDNGPWRVILNFDVKIMGLAKELIV